MGLVKCVECAQQVSSSASKCPHCGKRRTTPATKAILIFFAVAIGIPMVIGIVAAQNARQAPPDPATLKEQVRVAALTPEQRKAEAAKKEKEANKLSARFACGEFVRKSLHDPGSAELEDSDTYYSEEKKGGVYLVQVRLRARNAFNAMRASVVECKTTRDKKGNWYALSLKTL
jgi:hypothetical protein